MSDIIGRQLSQKSKHISVITLMAFLLAFFLHSQHISQPQAESNNAADYQDCHLCQQGVDSPPKAIRLSAVFREGFPLVIAYFSISIDVTQAYVIPQLRAPPFFL